MKAGPRQIILWFRILQKLGHSQNDQFSPFNEASHLQLNSYVSVKRTSCPWLEVSATVEAILNRVMGTALALLSCGTNRTLQLSEAEAFIIPG
jgi:hypothetical protein